ncbi:MAG: hypothetical protein ACREX9_06840 [Gammaproteobacteria bacterium]
MTDYETCLFLLLVGMGPVWFIQIKKLSILLQQRHPEKFRAMGMEHIYNAAASLALLRFLSRREHEALHYPELSRLAEFMRMFLVAYLALFIILVGSVFSHSNDTRKSEHISRQESSETRLRTQAHRLYREDRLTEAIAHYHDHLRQFDRNAQAYY